MRWVRQILSSLRVLLFRGPAEREMDEELQFHLAMQTSDGVQQGASPGEARRQAAQKLGGVEQVKEACRDARGYRWIEDLGKDLRYGWRTLTRRPGFTAIAVVTLALGIGANTAVFSIVNSVLLRELPFEDPDRLVMLWQQNLETDLIDEQVAPGDYFDWQANNRVFESLGYVVNMGSWTRNFVLSVEGQQIRIRARHASSSLFETLGTPPLVGRTFAPEEDQPGGGQTALLSYRFWQSLFNADREIVGRTIDIGEPYQVIGVMPPGFVFPEDADLWLSAGTYMTDRVAPRRDYHALWAVARLKQGVGAAEAEEAMSRMQARIAEANPDVQKIASAVTVVPLLDQVIGASTRPALLVLLGAVGFVLLIACANVANLMLARAAVRRKEIAIRTALGAGRLRVIRQLLTESLLLSLMGAAVGVLIARWGIDVIQALQTQSAVQSVKAFQFDRISQVSLDWTVLTFTLLISVATGVLFGLIPAVQTARIDLNETLKEESRGGTSGRTSRRLGNVLIVAEVALALMLLIGAAQMMLTFVRMQQVDPGLQPEVVLRAEIDQEIAGRRYPGSPQEVTRTLLDRVMALPDVVSAGAITEVPLRESGWLDTFAIEGRPAVARSELPTTSIRVMTPGAMETLGVPVLRGRDIAETDHADAPDVILVNEEFARRFFGDENPIGQRIRARDWHSFPWQEIVGVVGNVRNYRTGTNVGPEIYLPYHQAMWKGSELGPLMVVRTMGDPLRVVDSLRHSVEGEDSAAPILLNFRTLDDILDSSAAEERFRSILLSGFTGLAVLLAAVGVYGVISYSTSQRINEIGIRMALGAQPASIRRLIIGHGLAMGLIGIGLGLAASTALSRVLVSQFPGMVEANGVMLASSAAVLLGVTLVASYLPARRAMTIDPVQALRHG